MSTAQSVEPDRPAPSPAVSATVESPYVGPRPFLASDDRRFFGRDREAIDLKHRVMAHPITLLYSMSGAGKTSLINARLVPDLKEEGCVVLPPARVWGFLWNVDLAAIPNIHVFHALMSWQDHCDSDTAQTIKGRTLKEELAPRAKLAEDDDSLLVAVFDQFEELFTAYSSRWRDRKGFFEQLSDALESIPNLRVLLAMREDYVASVDPYASLVPEDLRTRFRLERLRRDAALEAVVNPLKGTGRRFAPGVATKLIDSLMAIHIGPTRIVARARAASVDSDVASGAADPSCSLETLVLTADSLGLMTTSEYVEPVQLQVVCQNLWSQIEPAEVEITAEHLAECGDVDTALARFYENCVKEAVESIHLREGAVRRWFTEELITPAGTRGLVLRGPERTGKLSNQAVDLLESHHLIHGEDRGGARWYELSHDRFLMPIMNANRRWQRTIPSQALFSVLQERAAAWNAAPEEKKPSLLLDKDDLIRAEAWKKSSDSDELGVSDTIQRFVDESRDAVETAEMAAQLEAERRQAKQDARRIKLLSGGAVVLLALVLCASAGLVVAINAQRIATEQRKLADVAAAKAKAAGEVAVQAAEASRVSEDRAKIGMLATKAALQSQRPSQTLEYILEAMTLIKARWELVDGDKSFDLIRNTLSRIYQRSMLGDRSQEVTDLAFAPRDWGKAFRTEVTPVVAFGGKGGQVEVWDLGNYDDPSDDRHLVPPIKLDLPNPGKKDRWISRVGFNPKGRMLAVASGDTSSVDPRDRGGAWVWTGPESLGARADLRLLDGGPDTGPVADVAFSPDGTVVATAGSRRLDSGSKSNLDGVWSGVVRCYNPKTGDLLHAFTLKGPARSVAFDRLGRRLVAASGDTSGGVPHAPGQVVVCDWNTKTQRVMEDFGYPAVRALFSPDGNVVVSGGVDGIGRVHDPSSGRLIANLVGHTQAITSLDFSHDGTRLVTASADRSARIWNPSSWSAFRAGEAPPSWSSQVTLVGHRAELLCAEFSYDGTLVVTGSHDRTARVWDAQTGECLVTHLGHEGAVNAARFRYRGFLMATAGSDKTARLWTTGNVETARLSLASRDALTSEVLGRQVPTHPSSVADDLNPHIVGHDAALRDVAFRPGGDGRYQAVTAGADGVACLWDLSRFDKPQLVVSPLRRFEPSPRSPLTDVDFSPDGERMATASLDGAVRVWGVESGAQLRLIQPESGAKAGAALGLTFSPKGTYLLTSWADGRMRLYRNDRDDSKPVAVWTGSASRLTPQLFDQDDRFVVTPNTGLLRVAGDAGSVSVWDVEKKGLVRKLEDPEGGLGPVADLAVSPMTGHVAAATMGSPGAVVVWEARSPYRRTARPLRHSVGVERVAFKPDGTALATESEDGMGRLWPWPLGDSPVAEILPGLTGPSPVLAFSKEEPGSDSAGGYLATDTGAYLGQVWASAGKTIIPLKGPRDRILTLAFRPGSPPEITSINHENRFQRWSLKDDEKGEPLGTCRGPNITPTAVALQPGGNLAASGTDCGALTLWSTQTGHEVVELNAHKQRVTSVAFSDDGRRLVSADRDGWTYVWPVPDVVEALKLGSSRPLVRDGPTPLASFRPDAETGCDPVSVARFLDRQGHQVITATGRLSRERWQPEPEMNARAFAYRVDLTSPTPRLEKLVAVNELKRDNTAEDLPIGLLTAAVSPRDGRIFLGTGGPETMDNLVRTIDQPAALGLKDTSLYLGHTDAILDLAVSPDGLHLATASVDNTARVWDIPNHQASRSIELRGHSGDISSVTFSPDSRFVLTISRQDGTARVWDRSGGEALYILGTQRAGLNSANLNDPPGPRQYTDDVAAAAFSPDGKLLITANGDGNAKVYLLRLCGDFDELKKVAEQRRAGFNHAASTEP